MCINVTVGSEEHGSGDDGGGGGDEEGVSSGSTSAPLSDHAGHPVDALLHGVIIPGAAVLLDFGDDFLGLVAGFRGISGLISALSPGVLDLSSVDGAIQIVLHGVVECHLASLQDICRDSLAVLAHHLICFAFAFLTNVAGNFSAILPGSFGCRKAPFVLTGTGAAINHIFPG